MFTDLVNRADIRMVKSGSRSCFTTEALERLRVLHNVIRKEFERNESSKIGVLGFIDHTHTTATELLDDAVVRNGLTDHAP